MLAISVVSGHAFQSPSTRRFSARVVAQAIISAVSLRRLDCVRLSRCVEMKLTVRPLTSIVASMAARPPLSSFEPVAMNGYFDRIALQPWPQGYRFCA
jgi:hypothetical protein